MVRYSGYYSDLESFFETAMMRSAGVLKPIDGKIILNMGPGQKEIARSIELGLPDWDASCGEIPFGDNCVDGIHAYHFLEYVPDPILMLQEFQRVLRPGGLVNICVSYYSGQMAFHDINYKNFFCETTWKYIFENPYYDRCEGKWLFRVNFNVIIGVLERNMVLLTQLEKRE